MSRISTPPTPPPPAEQDLVTPFDVRPAGDRYYRHPGDVVRFIVWALLTTIVILFVAGWLIWELSPLQEWIGTGKSYWDQLSDLVTTVTGWIGDLGGGSGTN